MDNGRVTVPNHIWAGFLLPVGSNDVSRVMNSTRVIAINMPNDNALNRELSGYRTSVDAIESVTVLDLLTALPLGVQDAVEAQVDSGPTQ